jgi:hypothetical protein
MDGTSYTFSCMLAAFCYAASIIVLLGTGLSIARVSKKIADVARQEGKEWRSWKDRRQLFRFVSVPGDLVDSSDSPRLSDAKKTLIDYRQQVLRGAVVTVPRKRSHDAYSLLLSSFYVHRSANAVGERVLLEVKHWKQIDGFR